MSSKSPFLIGARASVRVLLQQVRTSRCAALWLLLLTVALGGIVSGQDAARKVLSRTIPVYPPVAKQMHLSGMSKLQVVITPAGTVKSVKAVGGSPLFEKNATEAVKQWKFEPGDKETTEVIEVEFGER